MVSAKLREKTKVIFAQRYGRKISDQEAEEIMANLTAFMEAVSLKVYNGDGQYGRN